MTHSARAIIRARAGVRGSGTVGAGKATEDHTETPMKPPTPELQNTRIIHLAKRFVSLPFVALAALWRGVRTLWRRRRSDERVRADDQLRQSRARRTLRGLPPDHVP